MIKDRLEELRHVWANPEVTAAPEIEEKDFAAARKKIKAKLQGEDPYYDAPPGRGHYAPIRVLWSDTGLP